MDEFDIPIFKKTYELYKTLYSYRNTVAKQDRYILWQRCETIMLDIVEFLLAASQSTKMEKLPILEKTSVKLNLLRVLVRLSKEVKAIDAKKYIILQEHIDEIGKMLGGWIKATKSY
ncbi:MAG: diversity-generating retroelement protein Avd [Patescibacteria group bacterium]|nr:diversity-generating retroelement protein Avd [Patescibacteria group bacterium]MDE2438176.1 diversity-generating retroelement protein Avd [Patescibacteria group bacterium]